MSECIKRSLGSIGVYHHPKLVKLMRLIGSGEEKIYRRVNNEDFF
jgi:hypothetical protein